MQLARRCVDLQHREVGRGIVGDNRRRVLGTVDEGYAAADDQSVLDHGLGALDGRERRIVELRFIEGLTQSQIAHEVGISQMHVSRLIRSSLETMRHAIEEA